VIFVTVQKLRQTRAPNGSAHKIYRGVLLGWPRDNAPLVVLLHGEGERTLTTSHVRRVLHEEGVQQMFVETRNTIYRVACQAGSEAEWRLEMLQAASQGTSFREESGPTDVREPGERRKRRDSLP